MYIYYNPIIVSPIHTQRNSLHKISLSSSKTFMYIKKEKRKKKYATPLSKRKTVVADTHGLEKVILTSY